MKVRYSLQPTANLHMKCQIPRRTCRSLHLQNNCWNLEGPCEQQQSASAYRRVGVVQPSHISPLVHPLVSADLQWSLYWSAQTEESGHMGMLDKELPPHSVQWRDSTPASSCGAAHSHSGSRGACATTPHCAPPSIVLQGGGTVPKGACTKERDNGFVTSILVC